MTRCFHLLSLLALVACSSSVPTQYGQMAPGVPMPPPRAPAFNPTLDAPHTTGQPGYVGEPRNLPRGTDSRVLPPTTEPTIFASDQTRASVTDPVAHFVSAYDVIMGEDADATSSNESANTCRSDFIRRLNALMPGLSGHAAMTPEETKCLLARLAFHCLDLHRKKSTGYSEEWHNSSGRAVAAVIRLERKHCAKVSETPLAKDMWSKFTNGWPTPHR